MIQGKRYFHLIAITIAISLSSCASAYHNVAPESINYLSTDTSQLGIEFSYKYDILLDAGNKKCAKKESKAGIKVIAVKLTNHSNQTLLIGRDIAFYSGNREFNPLSPYEIKQKLSQKKLPFSLYMLLTPLQLQAFADNMFLHTFSIGYILGPSLTVFNIIGAYNANKRLKNNIQSNYIINRFIAPNETEYGILGLYDADSNHLSAQIKMEVVK